MQTLSRNERATLRRQQWMLLVALWCVLVISAVMVVHSAYESRLKFNELEGLRHEQNELHIVWGKYLLEESVQASFGRVEKIATEQLGMQAPSTSRVVMVAYDEK